MKEALQFDEFLPISQVAEQTGLTARALRFYEEIGLIDVHRQSTRRLYDQKTLDEINIIKNCRAMGLSLDAIRELLAIVRRDNSDQLRGNDVADILRAHEKELIAKKNLLDEQIMSVRFTIDSL